MITRPSLRHLIAHWQWDANEGTRLGRFMRAALALVMVGVPAAAALRWLPPPLATIMLALWLSITLLVMWALQFAALLRLDHPHAARLVPGHAASLRATALATWAVVTLAGGSGVAALLTWAPWPAGWSAEAGLGADLLPVALVAAGGLLWVVALAVRWPALWLLVVLLPASRSLPALLLGAVQPWWQARPWLACAALLALMALALSALFGRGDAAHARVWARRERWRRITQAGMVGQKPTLAAYGRWGEWLGAPWQRLADAWLARATRSAQPTAGSVMARAEIVLHGAQHWVRQVGVLVPLLVVMIGMFIGLAWHLGPVAAAPMFEHGYLGMSIGLACTALGAAVSLPGALWASRREQALLMLLPGMPRGARLNRALAWRQARHYLLLWALTLPACLVLAWAAKAPQVLVMPVVSLLGVAWLWRNVARQREPSALVTVLPLLSCLVPGIAAMLLLRERPDTLWPLLAALAAVAALLLPWRWRQLSRWPQALPAGRYG